MLSLFLTNSLVLLQRLADAFSHVMESVSLCGGLFDIVLHLKKKNSHPFCVGPPFPSCRSTTWPRAFHWTRNTSLPSDTVFLMCLALRGCYFHFVKLTQGAPSYLFRTR